MKESTFRRKTQPYNMAGLSRSSTVESNPNCISRRAYDTYAAAASPTELPITAYSLLVSSQQATASIQSAADNQFGSFNGAYDVQLYAWLSHAINSASNSVGSVIRTRCVTIVFQLPASSSRLTAAIPLNLKPTSTLSDDTCRMPNFLLPRSRLMMF